MVTREDFLTAVVAPIGNGWALRRHIQSPHADETGLRCELLFPAFGLCSDRGHQRLDANDVHHPGEIVGEHVGCHLGGDLGQTLHQKVCAKGPSGKLLVSGVAPDHGERQVPGVADIDDRQ